MSDALNRAVVKLMAVGHVDAAIKMSDAKELADFKSRFQSKLFMVDGEKTVMRPIGIVRGFSVGTTAVRWCTIGDNADNPLSVFKFTDLDCKEISDGEQKSNTLIR